MKKLPFIFLILLFSCTKRDLKEYSPVFKSVMISEEKTFREKELFMDFKEVLKQENEFITEKDTNYIFCEHQVDKGNFYTINYSFENKKLRDIQSEIFVDSKEKGDSLLNEFTEFYTEKYGEPQTAKGYLVWKLPEINKKTPEIAIMNDSENYLYGKLLVSVYFEELP